MRIYLVRHASAGSRRDWDQQDHLRPLSGKGRDRANQLAVDLADDGIERLLSSHYLRCTQSLGPLSAKIGVAIEEHDALAEGAPLAAGITLVEELIEGGSNAALCSHGDVIPELLAGLGRRGATIDPGGACPKGSVWILEVEHGAVARAVYAGR